MPTSGCGGIDTDKTTIGKTRSSCLGTTGKCRSRFLGTTGKCRSKPRMFETTSVNCLSRLAAVRTTTGISRSTQKSTTAFSRSTQTTTTAFSRSSQALTVLASGGGLLHRPPINLRSASNRLMFATRSTPYRFRRSCGRPRSDPSPTSFRLQMHPPSTSDRLQMHHMII